MIKRINKQLIKNKLFHKISYFMGNDLNPEKWVFVIGCYNSGTTLLSTLLSKHTEIDGLPLEGVYLTDVLSKAEDFGWTRMWHKCVKKIKIDCDDISDKTITKIKRQWSIYLKKNSRIILEKSQENAARLMFLDKYFKPAYFIYIVRNGYAVSSGIRKKSNLKKRKNPIFRHEYPIELCAKQWTYTDRIVQESKKFISNFIQISYEELTSNPLVTIKKITKFLKIDDFPEDLLKRDFLINNVCSKIKNMNSENLSYLSKEDILKINSIASDTLLKYGYFHS